MSTAQAFNSEDSAVSLSIESLINTRLQLTTKPGSQALGLNAMTGQIQGRRRGHGLDFEDLRTYVSGDDMRHIDWKVTARYNKLHTRLYREEKEQRVTVLLDFTAPMFTGSQELRAVTAGLLAAGIAWHETNAGARCGLMIQSNDGFTALRPALGDGAALQICATIAEQFKKANPLVGVDEQNQHSQKRNMLDAAQQRSAHSAMFDRTISSSRETGALIVISGIDQTESPFDRQLNELAVSKDIAFIKIEDPIEFEPLPNGHYHYQSRTGSSAIRIGDSEKQRLHNALRSREQQLRQLFDKAQVPLLYSRHGTTAVTESLVELGFLAS